MEQNMFQKKGSSIIIKFDFATDQTIGEITKVVGLTIAKYLIPIIDSLDLEATPQASKTGPVTTAIQESIEIDAMVFPFKTKGILLTASQYERLERSRIKITPDNPAIEGILDGGTTPLPLACIFYRRLWSTKEQAFPKGQKSGTSSRPSGKKNAMQLISVWKLSKESNTML